MSTSRQEEIIAVLWFIFALLLWEFNWRISSAIVLFWAVFCLCCSIGYAAKAALLKKAIKKEKD